MQVVKFLRFYLIFFYDFFLYFYEMRVCFFVQRCIIYTYCLDVYSLCFLFRDFVNNFKINFNLLKDFNVSNNFIRFLNFTFSVFYVNIDFSWKSNCNFSELMNNNE